MRIKRRTAVEVRTRQVTTVREYRQPALAWCEECAGRVQMVTPDRAAEMAHIPPRAIYRRVERGELHFIETAAGELLICCPSLTPMIDGTKGDSPSGCLDSFR